MSSETRNELYSRITNSKMNDDSLDFIGSENNNKNALSHKNIFTDIGNITRNSLYFLKKYWIYAIFSFLLVFLILINLKPNDYQFLLQEMDKLKKRIFKSIPTLGCLKDNIADISHGTYVSDHSLIYKYGLFKIEKTEYWSLEIAD